MSLNQVLSTENGLGKLTLKNRFPENLFFDLGQQQKASLYQKIFCVDRLLEIQICKLLPSVI